MKTKILSLFIVLMSTWGSNVALAQFYDDEDEIILKHIVDIQDIIA